MIIEYSENNEARIRWKYTSIDEWKTAELDDLISAYENKSEKTIGKKVKYMQIGKDGFYFPSEKTGKWINYKDEHRCSCCGETIIGDWLYEDDVYSYCPNCGAKMNEVEND